MVIHENFIEMHDVDDVDNVDNDGDVVNDRNMITLIGDGADPIF